MTSILSGLSLISVALAVIISAFIRLISAMQLRQRVEAGHTGVRELAELSGITDARDLQDVFGPPGMQRIWSHITLAQIDDKRRLAGYLMSDHRVHWVSVAVAVTALILGHWTLQIALILAALGQTGAWLSATQLPK